MRKKQVTHTIEFEIVPTGDPNAAILYARWADHDRHSYAIMRPSEIDIAIEQAERPEDVALVGSFRLVPPKMLERAQNDGLEPYIMAFLSSSQPPSLDWGDGIPEDLCTLAVNPKAYSVRFPDGSLAVTTYSFPVSASAALKEQFHDFLSESEVSACFMQPEVRGGFLQIRTKDHVRVELSPEQAEDWISLRYSRTKNAKHTEEKLRYLGVPAQVGDDGKTLELAEPTPQPGMS